MPSMHDYLSLNDETFFVLLTGDVDRSWGDRSLLILLLEDVRSGIFRITPVCTKGHAVSCMTHMFLCVFHRRP